MDSYYTNYFSDFPFLPPFTFLKQKHLWEPQIQVQEYDHSKREEVSDVETWMKGCHPVLFHWFFRTEKSQVPCGEGNKRQELGSLFRIRPQTRPSSSFSDQTFNQNLSLNIIKGVKISLLLIYLKFHYCSAPLLLSTYDVLEVIG